MTNEEREEAAYNKGYEEGVEKASKRLAYIYGVHDKVIRFAIVALKGINRRRTARNVLPGAPKGSDQALLESVIEQLEKALNP